MGNKSFGTIFLASGVILQLVVYILTQDSFLSFISGLCGVISVVLCSQRKISFYWFGFIQLFTYVWLCYQQKLYAEIAENVFYFVTMLYGLYNWQKHYDDNEKKVETRNLSSYQEMAILIGTSLVTILLYDILVATDDTQPVMDALTTVPAFVAQILMILRFKESWHYWLVIDVGSIIMWGIAGDWCMVAQFVFWTINCIYGLYKWKKL